MLPLTFASDAMAIFALQSTRHATTKFVIRHMKDNRLGREFESFIESLRLQNSAREAIEQPPVVLLSKPLENHGNHDIIRDILTTVQKRAGELSEIRVIAKGAP
ncbi:MAG: hypothetical protein ACJAT6_001296 [Akkermansiaceae bacterium]